MFRIISAVTASIIAFGLVDSAAGQGAQNVLLKPEPSAADGSDFYPSMAQALGKSGKVVLDCVIDFSGRPTGCAVMSEDPMGYGFGDAALLMAKRFKLRMASNVSVGAHAKFPVVFRVPAAQAPAPVQ